MLLIFIRTLEPSAVCMRLQKEDFPWGCKVSVFSVDTKQLRNMNEQWLCVPSMQLKGPSSKDIHLLHSVMVLGWWKEEQKAKKEEERKKADEERRKKQEEYQRTVFFFFGWGCSEHDFKHPWLASDLSCHILSFLSFITIRLSTVWLCFFKSIIQSLFLPFWLSSRPLIVSLFVWPWSTADLIQSGSWALIMFRRHFRRPGICNLKQSSLLGATCQGLCVCPAAHLLVCLLVYQSNCICMLCAKAFGKPYLHCVTNLRTS